MKPDLSKFRTLAEQFSLIRCRGKVPIEKEWQRYCRERRPFDEIGFHPGDNAGIACGPASGLLVLDIDNVALFEKACTENRWDMPETRAHQTGSGKLHFLFKYPSDGRSFGNLSRKDLGFDVRGNGGQAIAPGSIHPDTGKPYEVLHHQEPADPPGWLLRLYEPGANGSKPQAASGVHGFHEGQRDEGLFKYACRLRQLDLSREEAECLVVQAARNSTPPFPEREALRKLDGAWKYPGPNQTTDVDPPCLEDAFLTEDAFLSLKLPEKTSFLHPWLNENTITLVTGWRGIGKTWFSLGVLNAITRGADFGPWKGISPVNCLYVDGEMATQDIQARLLELGTGSRKAQLFVYSDAYANSRGIARASLLNPKWREAIRDLMLERQVRLWVADNISSLCPGVDENSKEAWDPVNQWLIELRFKGISTQLLHHESKDGKQRGTSGREDNIDVSISLKQPAGYVPEDGARFIASFSKSRIPTEHLPLIAESEFTLTKTTGDCLEWCYCSVKKRTKIAILEMVEDGTSQRDIAEALRIDKAYVSRVLKQATKDGLLGKNGKLSQKGFTEVFGK